MNCNPAARLNFRSCSTARLCRKQPLRRLKQFVARTLVSAAPRLVSALPRTWSKARHPLGQRKRGVRGTMTFKNRRGVRRDKDVVVQAFVAVLCLSFD